MEKSQTIGKLAAALAKAQGEIKGALKNANNPFFKSDYTDLQGVWDVARKPLADNELSIVQMPEEMSLIPESRMYKLQISTALLHSSGEYIISTLTIPVSKADAQGIGSVITYGRRYALAAMVGIYQADDDANAACETTAPDKATTVRENKKVNSQLSRSQHVPSKNNNGPKVCADCGAALTGAQAAISEHKYQRPLCNACQEKLESKAG